jgi:hypothetical protein
VASRQGGAAWAAGAVGHPYVGQVEPHQAAFQIAWVQPRGAGQPGHVCDGWAGTCEQIEVAGGTGGVRVQRRAGTGPDAAQLAEEDAHGNRPPPGQGIQGVT